MLLQDDCIRLRAMEPEDLEAMYRWENDASLWHLGDATQPFSREALREFIAASSQDMYSARQVRLMIEPLAAAGALTTGAVGCVDLFTFDPLNRRAGVGILIYDPSQRRQGYALAALRLTAEYAFSRLDIRQLWAEIPIPNTASLRLFERAGFCGTAIKKAWVRTPDGTAYEDARFVQLFR